MTLFIEVFHHALGFLGLSVLELGRGTRQTDGQTDKQTDTGYHFIMPSPIEVGVCTKRFLINAGIVLARICRLLRSL